MCLILGEPWRERVGKMMLKSPKNPQSNHFQPQNNKNDNFVRKIREENWITLNAFTRTHKNANITTVNLRVEMNGEKYWK